MDIVNTVNEKSRYHFHPPFYVLNVSRLVSAQPPEVSESRDNNHTNRFQKQQYLMGATDCRFRSGAVLKIRGMRSPGLSQVTNRLFDMQFKIHVKSFCEGGQYASVGRSYFPCRSRNILTCARVVRSRSLPTTVIFGPSLGASFLFCASCRALSCYSLFFSLCFALFGSSFCALFSGSLLVLPFFFCLMASHL